MIPVAPTLDAGRIQLRLDERAESNGFIKALRNATHDALRYADAAVVASGTATLETALLGCPMVVVYRVASGTAFFARFMVDVPYFSIVNLLAAKRTVAELIQNDFTGGRVADEIERLFTSFETRQEMLADFLRIRARLGRGGAARRASESIAKMLRENARPVEAPAF